MILSERVVGLVTIIDVEGDFVFGNVSDFRDKVNSLLYQERKEILVDLRRTKYIDSAGLGEIMLGHAAACRSGGELKLLGPTRRHHRLLTMVKLLTVLDSFEDEAEAIESYGSSSSASYG